MQVQDFSRQKSLRGTGAGRRSGVPGAERSIRAMRIHCMHVYPFAGAAHRSLLHPSSVISDRQVSVPLSLPPITSLSLSLSSLLPKGNFALLLVSLHRFRVLLCYC